MQKIIRTFTNCILSLSLGLLLFTPVTAQQPNGEEDYYYESLTDSTTIKYNSDGTVESFIVLGDSQDNIDLFGNYDFENRSMVETRAISWTLIGKFLVKVLIYVGEVVVISCIDGGNICKPLLQKRFAFPQVTQAEANRLPVAYWRRFTPGRVPGCEPMHSGPCNSGYWEYKLTRQ